MTKSTSRCVWFLSLAAALSLACGVHPAWLEPEEAGADFAVQGEYASRDSGAQVIALGDGAFRVVHLAGGLPGAGWDGTTRSESSGDRGADPAGAVLRFEDGSAIEGGVLLRGGSRLVRVERSSETLGALPPPGAVVVFGGNLDRVSGEMDSRGLLAVGASSKDAFGDARIHLEFRTPFMPSASGQARGNSGVYLQNRYEVQILDSFGLAGEWDECGGIYKVARPSVNMALPPLTWQTYDIDFRAARFDDDANRIAAARMTVRHNGVKIHEDVELPGPTGRGDDETAAPGLLYLQDHFDPVFFRNVWVLPNPDGSTF